MHPRSLLGAALVALCGCILGEAQKVDDAAGAGGSGGSTSSQTGPGGAGGGGGGGGAGGTGGMGGMPPTCTSQDPGATAWAAIFGETVAPATGTADQRIMGFAIGPDGIVILGRYARAMNGAGKAFPPNDQGGNAFFAWLTPEGDYVLDGSGGVLVLAGDASGPPRVRGLAVAADHVAAAGALSGALTVAGQTLPAPADIDALLVERDAGSTTAVAYPPLAAGLDQLDDVALGPAGHVFVSGFTEGGLTLPGGPVPQVSDGTNFVASVGSDPWVIPLATGYEAEDAIQIVTAPDGTLFLATSIKKGTYAVGGTIDVTSNSGVLVARVGAGGTVGTAGVFGGGGSDGEQAFLPDLSIGPDGRLVVMGSFFGDLVFDVSSAKVLTTTPGQTDGFVAVLDPHTLGATHWERFGTSANNETVWAGALDPCGDLVVLGTFRQSMTLGGAALVPEGPADFFVTKATLEPDGSIAPVWARSFGHELHVECAAANQQNERNCYRLAATEEGVYVTGAYAGAMTLHDGPPEHVPLSGEDSFVMKLSP